MFGKCLLINYLFLICIVFSNVLTVFNVLPFLIEFADDEDGDMTGFYVGLTLLAYNSSRVSSLFLWKLIANKIGNYLCVVTSLICLMLVNFFSCYINTFAMLIAFRVLAGSLNNLSAFTKNLIMEIFDSNQHGTALQILSMSNNFITGVSILLAGLTNLNTINFKNENGKYNNFIIIYLLSAIINLITLALFLKLFKCRVGVVKLNLDTSQRNEIVSDSNNNTDDVRISKLQNPNKEDPNFSLKNFENVDRIKFDKMDNEIDLSNVSSNKIEIPSNGSSKIYSARQDGKVAYQTKGGDDLKTKSKSIYLYPNSDRRPSEVSFKPKTLILSQDRVYTNIPPIVITAIFTILQVNDNLFIYLFFIKLFLTKDYQGYDFNLIVVCLLLFGYYSLFGLISPIVYAAIMKKNQNKMTTSPLGIVKIFLSLSIAFSIVFSYIQSELTANWGSIVLLSSLILRNVAISGCMAGYNLMVHGFNNGKLQVRISFHEKFTCLLIRDVFVLVGCWMFTYFKSGWVQIPLLYIFPTLTLLLALMIMIKI